MRLTATALALAALTTTLPAMAQQEARTGVSNPEPVVIEAQPDETVVVKTAPAKPSAAVPMTDSSLPAAVPTTVYGAYVPYTGPKRDGVVPAAAMTRLTEEEADGAVVMSVPDPAGALRAGSLLQTRTTERLSTTTTEEGARFRAELVEPVMKDGRVVLPVGSVVEGRVTTVHSGRRISGAAMIHVEANSIVLPDGTRYMAHLQLIDTDQLNHTKIDSEGSLVRRDHPKETLAAVGLATGGAAAAGALVGGGVGAAVGAGIGAGAGTILWLKQDRQETLPAHALLVFSLSEAMPLVPQAAVSESRAPRAIGNPDAMVVGDPQ